jgi:tricorn protease-like protein
MDLLASLLLTGRYFKSRIQYLFTNVANYSGTQQVYVIPIQGGLSKRITFESVGVKVHGWSLDIKVLYSYNVQVGPAGNWTLKQVDPTTLLMMKMHHYKR